MCHSAGEPILKKAAGLHKHQPQRGQPVLVSTLLLIAQPNASRKVLHWLYQLGGIGLVPLGMLDNSLIPLPGGMDVITILFCAQRRTWWPYYVIMSTIGAVLGGYTTYRLAGGKGKGRLAKVISRGHMKQVKSLFEKWGFGSIVIPALLPPPFPFVPFLIAAGAAQYPRGKFLAALTIGRGLRYSILGLLGYLYGRWIITVMRQHVYIMAFIGLALLVFSATIVFIRFRRGPEAYAP